MNDFRSGLFIGVFAGAALVAVLCWHEGHAQVFDRYPGLPPIEDHGTAANNDRFTRELNQRLEQEWLLQPFGSRRHEPC